MPLPEIPAERASREIVVQRANRLPTSQVRVEQGQESGSHDPGPFLLAGVFLEQWFVSRYHSASVVPGGNFAVRVNSSACWRIAGRNRSSRDRAVERYRQRIAIRCPFNFRGDAPVPVGDGTEGTGLAGSGTATVRAAWGGEAVPVAVGSGVSSRVGDGFGRGDTPFRVCGSATGLVGFCGAQKAQEGRSDTPTDSFVEGKRTLSTLEITLRGRLFADSLTRISAIIIIGVSDFHSDLNSEAAFVSLAPSLAVQGTALPRAILGLGVLPSTAFQNGEQVFWCMLLYFAQGHHSSELT